MPSRSTPPCPEPVRQSRRYAARTSARQAGGPLIQPSINLALERLDFKLSTHLAETGLPATLAGIRSRRSARLTSGEYMRRGFKIATAVAAISTLGLTPALGAIQQPSVPASGDSAFGPAPCNKQPQTGTLYLNSEVEPWLDVDPTSADDSDGPDFIGVYQQDRYSDGGARGLGASVSTDGGASFEILRRNELPKFTQCVIGSSNGSYERASDPWVSFGPEGDAHQISLSFNNTANLDNAVLVSRSRAGSGGRVWSEPIALKGDTNPAVFNDKESITADQNNANYVYAVWDRLVFPNERTKGKSYLNTAAFRGPTWFSRTTNGGSSWETARPIFDPGQNDQTIGNQIVALGNGVSSTS